MESMQVRFEDIHYVANEAAAQAEVTLHYILNGKNT
jgi:hypothetical protein